MEEDKFIQSKQAKAFIGSLSNEISKYDKIKRAIISVHTEDGRYRRYTVAGSGFIEESNGYVFEPANEGTKRHSEMSEEEWSEVVQKRLEKRRSYLKRYRQSKKSKEYQKEYQARYRAKKRLERLSEGNKSV